MNLDHRYLFSFILFLSLISTKCVAFEEFVVNKVNIEGLKSISKDVVRAEINFNLGEKLTTSKATLMIKALYNTNFFEQVDLSKIGDSLLIKLVERPFIAEINIIGVKNREDILKILKNFKVAQGLVYDPGAIDKVEKEIERYYLSQQRYGVHLETKVINKPRNRVSVTLHITEGEESKIAGIVFNGNVIFKDDILLQQLSHSKTSLFSWITKSDRYFKEKLTEDLENLKTFYMDHGYINFQVDSTQVSLTADKRKVYITINLTEGEQYKLGEVKVDGEFILPQTKILDLVKTRMKSGEVFSLKEVLSTKQAIEEALSNLGYVKAEAKFNYNIIEETKNVEISFIITPYKRYILRKLIITGNNLTEDFVIRRMLPQLEGTWISAEDLIEGKEQILRHGYANKVDIIEHNLPENNDAIDVEYKIEEKRNMQLSAGVNYSGGEGLGYELGADIKNFIGTGRDIGVSFNNTKVKTAYRFNYFNPYYTIDGIGFGYGLFYQRNRLSKYSKIADYATDTLGGDLNWSFPISRYSATFIALGYSKTKLYPPHDPPLEITDFVRLKGLHYREYSVTLGWKYNSLDRNLFPTKGFSHTISFKYNLPFSNLKHYQVHYESNFYRPIAKGLIFNFSSDLGYGKGYSKDPFPFFKNYFIGGADSLRGFEDRTLGPKDSKNDPIGGNLLINFRNAIILPIPFKPELESIIRPSIFLDVGQVYNTVERKKDRGLRYSTGVSLAINTPLGMPIILSLAKPLNLKPGDQTQTFSFTFSANY